MAVTFVESRTTMNTDLLLVSLQDLLTRHKLLSAEFLEQHYDRVSLGSLLGLIRFTIVLLMSSLSIITLVVCTMCASV